MFPILFRIGSHIVYSYTVSLVIGMIAGTWMAYHLGRTRLSTPSVVLDAGFWGLLGGLLGGRAGYVLSNWAYYVDHVDKWWALWEGGLSWHGALIGGCTAMAVWTLARGWLGPPVPDWRDLFDVISPGVALGGAFGWLGCLLSGCAFGAEATGYAPPLSWLTARLPDVYGVEEVRFLTQPAMILWCLLLCLFLWGTWRQLPRGLSFALFLLLYALADFAIGFLRGDGSWRYGLWLSQWFAAGEMGAALLLGAYVLTRSGGSAVSKGST